jgi:hypothetical protein
MKKRLAVLGACLLSMSIQLSSHAQSMSPVRPVTQTNKANIQEEKSSANNSSVKKVQGKKQKVTHVKPVEKKTDINAKSLSKK